MIVRIASAFALTAASSLNAQPAATPSSIDLATAVPSEGMWTYSTLPGGSEASFASSGVAQVSIRCTRATRMIMISKPAAGAAPFLFVWTSAQTRNIPASFDPATRRISVSLIASDSLLDAIAFSRGRVGISVSGQPPLVVPSWADTARVIEDCRV